MTEQHLNIKLTFDSYSKRVKSALGWTFLIYFILVTVVAFNTDFKEFALAFVFTSIIFIADYSRRLGWVKYAIETLTTNSKGVDINYYEKDNLISTTILWSNLNVTRGTTFTKNPIKYISIKESGKDIGSFYAGGKFDNKEVDQLYKKLIALKSANTL